MQLELHIVALYVKRHITTSSSSKRAKYLWANPQDNIIWVAALCALHPSPKYSGYRVLQQRSILY